MTMGTLVVQTVFSIMTEMVAKKAPGGRHGGHR